MLQLQPHPHHHHHNHLLTTASPLSPFPTLVSLQHLRLASRFPTLSDTFLPTRRPGPWPARAAESTTTAVAEDPSSSPDSPPAEGPIELPPSSSPLFATTDDPTPLQVATSVLLTGAISIFLFRSIRRRAKRAKELKFRSSEAKKTLKEEALESLNVLGSASIEPKAPPSPVQALLGGLTAGVIALILYKFTTTIETALNRQTISDNFSVKLSPSSENRVAWFLHRS